MGNNCTYSGKNNYCERLMLLSDVYTLVPVCPEQMGGLPTPRHPAEIRDDRVVNNIGEDVTDNYRTGAENALSAAQSMDIHKAVLKARSPSCGCGKIYDGTFTHTVVDGDGVCAALLKKNGIEVYSEENLEKLEYEAELLRNNAV